MKDQREREREKETDRQRQRDRHSDRKNNYQLKQDYTCNK